MINYSDEADRWKLLSKELILKQEVINRNKAELKNLQDQIKDKGHEMTSLRSENFLLDQQIYELKENLIIEQRILSTTSTLPKEIQ